MEGNVSWKVGGTVHSAEEQSFHCLVLYVSIYLVYKSAPIHHLYSLFFTHLA